jgi:hypothetical protein
VPSSAWWIMRVDKMQGLSSPYVVPSVALHPFDHIVETARYVTGSAVEFSRWDDRTRV